MLRYGQAKFTLRLDWSYKNTPLFCDSYAHRRGCIFIYWKSALASRDRCASNAYLAVAQSIALHDFLRAVFWQLFYSARLPSCNALPSLCIIHAAIFRKSGTAKKCNFRATFLQRFSQRSCVAQATLLNSNLFGTGGCRSCPATRQWPNPHQRREKPKLSRNPRLGDWV